ncbi:hypothetical protein CGSHi3655_09781, partial [Haemophilus influenzae 3655]
MAFPLPRLIFPTKTSRRENFPLNKPREKALAKIGKHGLITLGKNGSENLIGGKEKKEEEISENGGKLFFYLQGK